MEADPGLALGPLKPWPELPKCLLHVCWADCIHVAAVKLKSMPVLANLLAIQR